jgi:mRNA-degrading endonuclease RelE of RelBE toxin-antitoxin system
VRSRVTKQFRKLLEKLPPAVQDQADKAYALWQTDPYHPSLQFKRVSQRQAIYSVRVGIGYRAMGLLETNQIYWFWIGSHAEYDQLLKRL